jgi:Haem-binding domain
MTKALRILKWLAVACACILIGIQFTGPAKSNPAITESQTVQAHLQVTPQVNSILERSCNDCHSSKTRWPWYSNVAPVSWFVIDHVNHGRSHLNFSEWGQMDQREAAGMLTQICKLVKADVMPLSSYTPLHPGSKLSEEDKRVVCDWVSVERQRIAK